MVRGDHNFSSREKGFNQCIYQKISRRYSHLSLYYFSIDIEYNFKKNPGNKTVVNGSKVEIECQAPSHFPNQVNYKWYKNYRVMSTSGQKSISSSGSLIITEVLKSDEGVYVCEATNKFSLETRTSTAGYLTVNGMFTYRVIFSSLPYFTGLPYNPQGVIGINIAI